MSRLVSKPPQPTDNNEDTRTTRGDSQPQREIGCVPFPIQQWATDHARSHSAVADQHETDPMDFVLLSLSFACKRERTRVGEESGRS